MTIAELAKAAQTADDAWSQQLQAAFGKQAGDKRYTDAGMGEPGTPLREAHDAFMAAVQRWWQAQHYQRVNEAR